MHKLRGRINVSCLLCKRFYTNNSKGAIKDYVYTKYRIALPHIDNVKYDDLYLSMPNREDLHVFSKKIPIFLRFLKLITSLENRNKDFIEFAKRCENGLTVERDVYLTKEELLENMFINGYSKREINAFDLAFTKNYEFHYPEISVLFQLDEEDVYKYCLKKRSENPEKLFHLKFLKPKNMLSSYGLIFVFLYFGLNNFVLCNAWFLSKTIPFFSVFYMLASYFYKDIWNYLNKEKKLMLENNVNTRLSAEDILYNQLKLYSKDTECSSHLLSFKNYTEELIKQYRRAYINEQKRKVTEHIEKKLHEIHMDEKNFQDSLKSIIVNELINDITYLMKTNNKFYDDVFYDALNSIGNKTQSSNKEDTLIKHVRDGLSALKTLNKQNSFVKRVLEQYDTKKNEYVNKYVVHKEEINKIKEIGRKCNMDISKLNATDYNELLKLFYNINDRFGFFVDTTETDQIVARDEEAKPLVNKLNMLIANSNKTMREKQLVAFMKEFQ